MIRMLTLVGDMTQQEAEGLVKEHGIEACQTVLESLHQEVLEFHKQGKSVSMATIIKGSLFKEKKEP